MHRNHDTLDFARVASGLLVTFTALVLSVLLSTVNGDFRKAEADLRTYGAMITELDGELIAFGAAADNVRVLLRRYTADAIASTWPDETPPPGADLHDLLPGDGIDFSGARHHAATGRDGYQTLGCIESRIRARAGSRSRPHGGASRPALEPHWRGPYQPVAAALMILLAWLVIVFFGFGMTAPANAASLVTIGLIAVSVAAAFFVILELDGPLDGVIQISSEPLRRTLLHLTPPPRRRLRRTPEQGAAPLKLRPKAPARKPCIASPRGFKGE